MADRSPLVPLEAAVAALVDTMRQLRVRGVVIGGVAASLLGRPRTTRDVDAVVWLEAPKHWPQFLQGAHDHGIVARIEDPLGFAARSRVLLLRHGPSGIDIDVALGALPFEEEAISHAFEGKLGRLRIPLPRPEDLVIMKAVAHRPRDAADIEAVLDAHPNLDLERIRRWVGEFAMALDTPDLIDDLEVLLRRASLARPPQAPRGTRGDGPGTTASSKRRTPKKTKAGTKPTRAATKPRTRKRGER